MDKMQFAVYKNRFNDNYLIVPTKTPLTQTSNYHYKDTLRWNKAMKPLMLEKGFFSNEPVYIEQGYVIVSSEFYKVLRKLSKN